MNILTKTGAALLGTVLLMAGGATAASASDGPVKRLPRCQPHIKCLPAKWRHLPQGPQKRLPVSPADIECAVNLAKSTGIPIDKAIQLCLYIG